MTELKKKCVCPTCKVPVQVRGLHKNLTFSTLVACTSKLKDLLENRAAEEAAKEFLESSPCSFEETQLPEILSGVDIMPHKDVLEALRSVADSSDSEHEPMSVMEPAVVSLEASQMCVKRVAFEESKSEPQNKRLAKRSGKATPKTTPTVNPKAPRIKTPASVPVQKVCNEDLSPVVKNGSLKISMSGLKPDDKALITDYCKEVQKDFKVQLASDYDPKTVNRIIMDVNDEGLCTRTTKYLRGILDGKVIVTLTWFLDSLAQKEWLPADKYLVQGDTSVGKETGAVPQSLKSGQKLFSDYTFYLAGRFATPSKADLTTLLKSGGAKVLVTRPKLQEQLPENHMIIYDPDQLDDSSLWIMSYDQRTSGLWVLDCISSFKILPIY